jgi:hypothetical protein
MFCSVVARRGNVTRPVHYEKKTVLELANLY